MRRVLISPRDIRDGSIVISSPNELHHLRDVLRVQVGESLECFDGQGQTFTGRVIRLNRRSATVQIIDRSEQAQGRTIGLAVALIKPERFDWLIQKATELGVERIHPLVTHRTITRPSAEQGERRRERWQRIAEEAAKQCGRATVPILNPPTPFETFLAGAKPPTTLLIPTRSAHAVSLDDAVKAIGSEQSVTILIGPEGDFTPEEVALAQTHGARPVFLGPLTLRSETAAIAALAILQHRLNPAWVRASI